MCPLVISRFPITFIKTGKACTDISFLELKGYVEFMERSYSVAENIGLVEIRLTRAALFFDKRVTIRKYTHLLNTA